MKKLISFLLILTLLLTAVPVSHADAKAKKYNANLTAGEYVVGEDIPVGKYTLTGVDEWGMVYVYKTEDAYDNDELWKNLISICSKDRLSDLQGIYQLTYKNLKLKKGYYVVITNGLSVNFKAK